MGGGGYFGLLRVENPAELDHRIAGWGRPVRRHIGKERGSPDMWASLPKTRMSVAMATDFTSPTGGRSVGSWPPCRGVQDVGLDAPFSWFPRRDAH
jgi:hypothetical protein